MRASFRIDSQEGLDVCLAALKTVFLPAEDSEQHLVDTYYDTFDWRLYGKGRLLRNRFVKGTGGYQLSLRCSEPDALNRFSLVQPDFPALKANFFHVEAVEEAELRSSLEKLAENRALLEIVTVGKQKKRYRLLNGDGKTVARLSWTVASVAAAGDDVLPLFSLTLSSLRGYEREYDSCVALLSGCNGGGEVSSAELAASWFLVVGRTPFDYTSGFSLQLDACVSLQEAVSAICLSLAGTLLKNFNGVVCDIDTEFLHDYRVALRRARSLLSQLRQYIPDGQGERFRRDLQWLGSLTGSVRDRDVYLQKRLQFATVLPGALHRGLDCFYDDLQKERDDALKVLVEALHSARYDLFLRDWQEFFTEYERHILWQADPFLCRKIAVKKIRKRFVKILLDGNAIQAESPDEELHALRIQCKKLRYLLEFFASFYPEEEFSFFLKQLKKLQNLLGECNDLSVQQEMLLNMLENLTGRSRKNSAKAAAFGGLCVYLQARHQQLRASYMDVWKAFVADDNPARFSKLLRLK